MQFFNHSEGYLEPDGSGGYDYIYQYKDHLGNIRLAYGDDKGDGIITASTEIREINNYYPFGLEHKGYNNSINGVENNYMTYNGKELEESLGLNWLDYGWRNYQPDLGRWMNIDNLAGMMKSQSPYSYALNNPIYYIDIDGLMPGSGPNHITDYYRGPDGTVYFDPNVDENTVLPNGYTYIGPTYYDEASRTVWGPDGKPMRLNPIALDEVVVTSEKVKSNEGSPTYWGLPGFGYEDRGRKGKRKGELSHGDLPGSGSAKGGGNSWSRFIKWLNGIINRGTKVQDVNVVTTPPGTSTMEQKPETEPGVEEDTILRIYPDPILTTRTKNPMGVSVRGYILKDTVIKNTEENVKKVNKLSSKRINDYDK
ncbi:RHS repeat-associated core domain-containing protein [Poritiphilus flavus]|uniref:RHS repeat-associated core domain-containing protein n=1 Tax=Poritiphilus flavus TaxID=2697053 RepID=UPI001EE9DE76|nr:RHS repeat-associated core domain-containing protein [Poritiphilus flavus]